MNKQRSGSLEELHAQIRPVSQEIKVIRTVYNRGSGNREDDPVRKITAYYDPESGACLAELDPEKLSQEQELQELFKASLEPEVVGPLPSLFTLALKVIGALNFFKEQSQTAELRRTEEQKKGAEEEARLTKEIDRLRSEVDNLSAELTTTQTFYQEILQKIQTEKDALLAKIQELEEKTEALMTDVDELSVALP